MQINSVVSSFFLWGEEKKKQVADDIMKRIDTWRVTAYEQKENHYHNNRWHDCHEER